MAGWRVPQDEMVLLVINPRTKRKIDEVTLRKAFKVELETGFSHLRTRIQQASVRSALGEKDQQGNWTLQPSVTAQIWLGKTLYGMRETTDVIIPPASEAGEENQLDAARRVAFCLAQGAHIVKAKASKT